MFLFMLWLVLAILGDSLNLGHALLCTVCPALDSAVQCSLLCKLYLLCANQYIFKDRCFLKVYF